MSTLEACSRSKCAPTSETNEDTVILDPASGVFILSDGMGGRPGGEVASRRAALFFREGLEQEGRGIPSDPSLRLLVDGANGWVRQAARADPSLEGMGCTLSAILLHGEEGKIIHLGDSKVFLFRGGKLKQLTVDHTAADEFKKWDPDSAALLPSRFKNMLTRAIGIEEKAQPQIETLEVHPGDRFILASDGLTKVLEPTEILEAATEAVEEGAKALCEALFDLAKSREPADDLTVAVVAVFEASP